jgi:hypothetical protein
MITVFGMITARITFVSIISIQYIYPIMKKPFSLILYSVITFLALLTFSCSDLGNEKTYDLTIVNEPEELSSRVTNTSTPIVFNSGSFKMQAASETQAAFKFTQYQTIATPESNMSATYIAQRGNYLYITYHHQGPTYGGGIDVYNIRTSSLDALVTNAEIDWNSLMVDEVRTRGRNGRLIIMGDTPNGAILQTIGIANEIINSAAIVGGGPPSRTTIQNEQRVLELDGPSGNSVIKMENSTRLYASTGGTAGYGGVFEIDYQNLKVNNKHTQANMKYLAAYGTNKVVALQAGVNANLVIYDHPNFNGKPTATYPIGSIDPLDGKNDIFVSGDIAYAAMGNNGIAVVDLTNGSVIKNIELPGTTNAVFVDDDFIYASNGEMFHLINNSTYAVLGSISFEGSANFVHTFRADIGNGIETVIALANGTSGVRLIAAREATTPRDIQQVSDNYSWAPSGTDRFSVGQLSVGESMQFEIKDASGAVVESFGVDLPGGMGIHFQTSVEGALVRATFNGLPGFEEDALGESATQPTLNLDPLKGDGGVKRLTSRFDQNGRHIFSVDYEGTDIALIEINQDSGPNFDLVLQNGRNFFYAADGTCVLVNKTTGQNIHTKASNNNTWGGIN